MWRGDPLAHQYTVDFVNAHNTASAITPPPGYHLYYEHPVGQPGFGIGLQRLTTLEDSFSVPKSELKEGEGAFVILEGMTCLLTCPPSIASQHFDVPSHQ